MHSMKTVSTSIFLSNLQTVSLIQSHQFPFFGKPISQPPTRFSRDRGSGSWTFLCQPGTPVSCTPVSHRPVSHTPISFSPSFTGMIGLSATLQPGRQPSDHEVAGDL